MKYKTKPYEVEAIQWTGENVKEVKSFCGDAVDIRFIGSFLPFIHTLEGDMRANAGDYIIKGLKGEFYPCKPDVFTKEYELVEE